MTSRVRELHDEAMRLAQEALLARDNAQWSEAASLAQRAFRLESEAADLIPEGADSEPTRSILYRSAASLAYQARDLKAAQRLIAQGLSGAPPSQIEEELRELERVINFERQNGRRSGSSAA